MYCFTLVSFIDYTLLEAWVAEVASRSVVA